MTDFYRDLYRRGPEGVSIRDLLAFPDPRFGNIREFEARASQLGQPSIRFKRQTDYTLALAVVVLILIVVGLYLIIADPNLPQTDPSFDESSQTRKVWGGVCIAIGLGLSVFIGIYWKK
jgi:hypothetical protein